MFYHNLSRSCSWWQWRVPSPSPLSQCQSCLIPSSRSAAAMRRDCRRRHSGIMIKQSLGDRPDATKIYLSTNQLMSRLRWCSVFNTKRTCPGIMLVAWTLEVQERYARYAMYDFFAGWDCDLGLNWVSTVFSLPVEGKSHRGGELARNLWGWKLCLHGDGAVPGWRTRTFD